MGWFSFLTRKGRSPHDLVNIASPEFKANPYPIYARLRAEAPVYRVVLPTKETAWLITRYEDVAMVLKDERFVKNTANALTPEQLAGQPWFKKVLTLPQSSMLFQDPPKHTRLRALVNKAFTPRVVERMGERIQRLTDELLDSVRRRGRMDLVGDYALPLALTIISEMLGVPAADRRQFHRWSHPVLIGSRSALALVTVVPSAVLLSRYLRKFITKRRAKPQDDLVSALARAEEAGDTLSEKELLAMVFLLLVAGYETTVNLIGNGMLALLEHPGQMEKLRNDPALIKSAVEELLRYAGPLEMATERFAREDVTMAGQTIPRGDMVYAVIASANRDEQQFVDPDTLDITREPNKHLSFGLGNHFCVGATLARLEGRIAINTLLGHAPDLRLAVAPKALRWRGGRVIRGLEALPVAWGQTRRPGRVESRNQYDPGLTHSR
jgi:cytochrome P450 PksS